MKIIEILKTAYQNTKFQFKKSIRKFLNENKGIAIGHFIRKVNFQVILLKFHSRKFNKYKKYVIIS